MSARHLTLPLALLALFAAIPAALRVTERPGHSHVAVGRHYMVAADHPLASQAGAEVLARGGNAVDAVVAAALATGVVRPESAGLGGGAFIVFKPRGQRAVAIDCRETAPRGATVDRYLEAGKPIPDHTRYGGWAVGVPGLLRGLVDAHEVYGSGRVAWRDVVQPAARLAQRGFPVDAYLAEASRTLDERLAKAGRRARFPATSATFVPGGQPLQEGDTLRQPALARTLRRIAADPESFYRGAIADAIVAEVARLGGPLDRADLAGYRAVHRAALAAVYDGRTYCDHAAAELGGAAVLQILGVLDRLPPGLRLSLDEPTAVHVLVELMKHAFADRARLLGDPNDAEHGAAVLANQARMLAPARLARLATSVGPRTLRPRAYGLKTVRDDAGTTHISAVDARGNACAITLTVNLGFGSYAMADGIVLNNELDDFTVDPSVPNAFGLLQSELNVIAPGRRPLSSMTPLIVTDADDRVELVVGASGGPKIITATLLTTLAHLTYGEPLPDAVARPRLHHQWSPDELYVEPGVPAALRDRLALHGHTVVPFPGSAGHVQAVSVSYDAFGRARLVGVSSPRKGGAPSGR